jgi:hypothetical protein
MSNASQAHTMLILIIPSLLLSLPILFQTIATFWRLRSHESDYLWAVFSWALLAQLLTAVAATLVSAKGFSQKGILCATGAVVFLVGGVVLAAIVIPLLALLAVLIRWLSALHPQQ